LAAPNSGCEVSGSSAAEETTALVSFPDEAGEPGGDLPGGAADSNDRSVVVAYVDFDAGVADQTSGCLGEEWSALFGFGGAVTTGEDRQRYVDDRGGPVRVGVGAAVLRGELRVGI
jgi:hypothetical protein